MEAAREVAASVAAAAAAAVEVDEEAMEIASSDADEDARLSASASSGIARRAVLMDDNDVNFLVRWESERRKGEKRLRREGEDVDDDAKDRAAAFVIVVRGEEVEVEHAEERAALAAAFIADNFCASAWRMKSSTGWSRERKQSSER